jgi:hypothetical protein
LFFDALSHLLIPRFVGILLASLNFALNTLPSSSCGTDGGFGRASLVVIPDISDHEAVVIDSSLRPIKKLGITREVWQYRKEDYVNL